MDKQNRINWNGQVTLKPNSRGWYIWERHWRNLGMEPPDHGDTLTLELWDAANIFGQSLYNGGSLPFEDTEMDYQAP